MNDSWQSSRDEQLQLQSIVSFEVDSSDSNDPFEIDGDDLKNIYGHSSEDESLLNYHPLEPETITDSSTSEELELYLPKRDSLCASELLASGYSCRKLSQYFQIWDHPNK